ncbi:hypothetical protein CASFOL_000923 [Castilleja foliolosa]|uniref:Nucleoside diphosphate kinase-like domain-containing protein n=2 Tax=Castilleja foliolosa TaxID=1961234 RepID=A0ABD3ELQ6_9LAMI
MALRFANHFEQKSIFLCLLVFLYGASANIDTTKEKTLAMVKPDGVHGKYVDVVKKSIFDSGFSIIHEIELQLDENTVKSFYAEHSPKSFFSSLVQYMTSGPVLIMVLEKENAIADWRSLIGPTDANRAKTTHPR